MADPASLLEALLAREREIEGALLAAREEAEEILEGARRRAAEMIDGARRELEASDRSVAEESEQEGVRRRDERFAQLEGLTRRLDSLTPADLASLSEKILDDLLPERKPCSPGC